MNEAARSWMEFAGLSPDLAAFGVERIEGKVAYLASIRPDGTPRVHPVTPHIEDGILFVYMAQTSPKAHDLQRNGHYSLHCSVENNSGGKGEFAIRGTAIRVEDPKLRIELFHAATTRGFYAEPEYVLFELRIAGAQSTVYISGQPTRKRWP